MILLGLRAQLHLDSGLSPHQQAFRTELTLPADFASKKEEELDELSSTSNWRKWEMATPTLQLCIIERWRRSLSSPEESQVCASLPRRTQTAIAGGLQETLQSYGTKQQHLATWRNNVMEDQVAINRLKPFHIREGEELDLQPLWRRGWLARVVEPAALRSPTPTYSPSLTSATSDRSVFKDNNEGLKSVATAVKVKGVHTLYPYSALYVNIPQNIRNCSEVLVETNETSQCQRIEDKVLFLTPVSSKPKSALSKEFMLDNVTV